MVASVIVDVKNNQVNRAFDYDIPDKFSYLQKGSRVIVPFGPRKLLGFVIDIKEESDFDKLKPILEVLDIVPSINDEMLMICKKMAENTNSFLISTLLTVIPNMMKAKYQKLLHRLNDNICEEIKHLFKANDYIPINDNLNKYMKIIQKEINNNNLEVYYEVLERASIKSIKMLKINDLSFTDITKRQNDVISYLLKGETKKSDLISDLGVSDSVIKKLIEKNIIVEYDYEIYREIKDNRFDKNVVLNGEQEYVYNEIKNSLNTNKKFLLHGVTGSGKTEIYIKIIEDVIKNNKNAIMLVPEISLTPQMVNRFKGHFKENVAVLHSALSDGERYDEWRKIQRKEVKIVVGARSAIFAPFENLGIIIIDEAHETSYKQDDSPRYNAKDIAILRGEYHNCPIVLGSATPNVIDYYNATLGLYQLLEIKNRANQKKPPKAIVVDMKEELKSGNKSPISRKLEEKIREKLDLGEQIILLLNRRGHSSFVMCRSCGDVVKCPNCDVTLTYHLDKDYLKCHYCGYSQNNISSCPSCKSNLIKYVGTGTEKIVEELNKKFKEARIIRMDQDTTSKKGSHEEILTKFRNHECDILVGTQMIAKGLDFPNVTLVGILMADLILKMPDFRSSEKTFDLIQQVSGRAGRHEKPGEVIVQAYDQDHYSIICAANNNYLEFYNTEMNVRKHMKYSPYMNMCQLLLTGPDKNQLYKEANNIINMLDDEIKYLGPSDSIISKINNKFRVQLTLKYNKSIDTLLSNLNEKYQGLSDIYITIDKL